MPGERNAAVRIAAIHNNKNTKLAYYTLNCGKLAVRIVALRLKKILMDQIKTGGFKLIGLKLPHKTSNEGGQSQDDCGALWQRFNEEGIKDKIPGKISDDTYAVYYGYEGDHTRPFSYFVGCRVKMDTRTPEGLDGIFIPAGTYKRTIARGPMPDCVINAWKRIGASNDSRGYQYDFEVYGEKSKDWKNAEVEIYLS